MDEQTPTIQDPNTQTEMINFVPNGVNWTLVSPNSVDPGHKHTGSSLVGVKSGLMYVSSGSGVVDSTGFTISGLDLNTDKLYMLQLVVSNKNVTAGHSYSMRVNGQTGADYGWSVANFNSQQATSGDSKIHLIDNAGGAGYAQSFLTVHFSKTNSTPVYCESFQIHWQGGWGGDFVAGGGIWPLNNKGAINLTSITVYDEGTSSSTFDYQYWLYKYQLTL